MMYESLYFACDMISSGGRSNSLKVTIPSTLAAIFSRTEMLQKL